MVQTIAAQCYLTGGPAVLQARSMYFSLIGTVDNSFAENCIAQTGSFKKEQEKKVSTTSAKLYPNPLNSNAILTIELPQNANVKFYNSFGQLVFEKQLQAGISALQTADIHAQGTYMAKVKYANGISEMLKFSILK
jgi:hypothetical protein